MTAQIVAFPRAPGEHDFDPGLTLYSLQRIDFALKACRRILRRPPEELIRDSSELGHSPSEIVEHAMALHDEFSQRAAELRLIINTIDAGRSQMLAIARRFEGALA